MSHFVDRQVDVEREANSHIKMETWLFWQSAECFDLCTE